MTWKSALFLSSLTLAASCSRAPATSPSQSGIGGNRGPGQPTLGVVLLEDFTDRQVFPADNWWNLDISTAPPDPQSQAYLDWNSGASPRDSTPSPREHPRFAPPPH